MDQKIFLIHELLSSKSHALAGSVSELSHTEAIFSPPKCWHSLFMMFYVVFNIETGGVGVTG